jgi:FixJ family two-component response regulator
VTGHEAEGGKCTVAVLVGADPRHGTELIEWADAVGVRLLVAGSLAELTPSDLDDADLILGWDEGGSIELLRRQLAAAGRHLCVLAVGQSPTVRRVVRAMNCGAADYIEWPREAHLLLPAIRSAENAGRRAAAPVAPTPSRDALSRLSRRERQVLGLMAEGMTNKIIARSLKISPRTVEIHRANMLEKLKSKSSADAIRLFFEATMPAHSQSRESIPPASEHEAAEYSAPEARAEPAPQK